MGDEGSVGGGEVQGEYWRLRGLGAVRAIKSYIVATRAGRQPHCTGALPYSPERSARPGPPQSSCLLPFCSCPAGHLEPWPPVRVARDKDEGWQIYPANTQLRPYVGEECIQDCLSPRDVICAPSHLSGSLPLLSCQ